MRKSRWVIAAAVLLFVVALAVAVPVELASAERGAREAISAARLGMTEGQVRAACGPPTGTGSWTGSIDSGTILVYAFPHWWDELLWVVQGSRRRTDQGYPLIEGARRVSVKFRDGTGARVVSGVEYRLPGSRISRVMKGR